MPSQSQPFLHCPSLCRLNRNLSCPRNPSRSFTVLPTFTTVSRSSASLIQRASLSPAFLTLTTAPVTTSVSTWSPISNKSKLSQASSTCLCSRRAIHRPPALLASSSQSGATPARKRARSTPTGSTEGGESNCCTCQNSSAVLTVPTIFWFSAQVREESPLLYQRLQDWSRRW